MLAGWTDRVYLGGFLLIFTKRKKGCLKYIHLCDGQIQIQIQMQIQIQIFTKEGAVLKQIYPGGGEREVKVSRGAGAGALTLTSSG